MSRTSRLFAIAIIACAAAADAFALAAVASRDYVVSAVHRAWDFVTYGFRVSVDVRRIINVKDNTRVQLVAAKAFIMRMMKRERPTVTPIWRMCPSI